MEEAQFEPFLPVVTLLGPRQSGKTTLTGMTFPDMPYFSLEDPDVRMAAEADPRGFLARMQGGGVLDEMQRLPLLLSCSAYGDTIRLIFDLAKDGSSMQVLAK